MTQSTVIQQTELPESVDTDAIIKFIDDRIQRGMYQAQTVQTPEGQRVVLEERACYMIEPDMRTDLTLFLDSTASKYFVEEQEGDLELSMVLPVQSRFLMNPVGGGVPAHIDWVQADRMPQHIIVLAYFNEDFEGGELFFPELDKTIKPKPGMVVAFDSRNIHKVNPLKSGRRYCIQRGYTVIDA